MFIYKTLELNTTFSISKKKLIKHDIAKSADVIDFFQVNNKDIEYLTLTSETDDVFDESDKNEQHCVECIAIDDHIGARSDEITCKKGDHLFLFHVDHDGFWRVMLAYSNGPRLMVGLMPKSKIEIINFDVKSKEYFIFQKKFKFNANRLLP